MVAAFSNSNGGWITAEEAEVGYTADYFGMNVPPWGCSYWYQSNPYAGFWTLIECAKVAGACCLPDHSCSAGSPDDCTSAGGVYQGHGTTCAQVNCAPPTGACCRTDGTCLDTTQANCATLGGTFHAQASCAITDCTPERYSNTIASPYTYFYSIAEYADDLTLAGSGPGYLIHYDVKVYRPSGGGSYSVTAALHTGCPPTTGNQIAGTVFTWNGLAEGNVLTLNANFPPVSISGTVWLRLQFSATDAGWIIAEQAEIGSTQNIFAAKAPNWGCNAWLGGSPWAGFWANLTFGGGLDVPSEPSAWVESEIPEVAPAAVQPQLWNAGSEPIPDDQPLRVAPPENLHVLPLALHGMASDQSRSGTVTLYLNSPVAGQTIAAGTTVNWTIRALVSATGNSGLALLSTDLAQDAGNPHLFDIAPATAIGPLMAAFDRPAGISNPGPTGSAFGGTQVGTAGAKNLLQIGGSQNTFGLPGVEAGLDTSVTPGIGQSGQTIIASGSFAAPQTTGSYTFRLQNAVATVLDNVSPPAPPAHWPVSAATLNLTSASFSFTVQGVCIGDLSCDDRVDFGDINPFVLYLSNQSNWQTAYPGCPPQNGDINSDGTYGQGSFGDINPFVALLSSQPLPILCP